MKEEYTGQQDLRGHDVNETINEVTTPKTLPAQPGDQCSANSESDVCNSTDILQRIRRLLNQDDVHFVEIEHEPTRTSEDSARARGEPLHVGAKALVLKIDGEFRLLVLPADRRLDSSAVKRHFQAKKVRFASTEELKQLTSLPPGAVPPFGDPVLSFELFADDLIGDQDDKVAFNAGSLTHSIVMRASDWIAAAKPKQFRFSK